MSSLWTPILNLPSPPPELISFFTRFEYITVLVSQLIALVLFVNLLLYAQFYGGRLGKKIQATFRLFLLFHSIGILTSLPASMHNAFQIFNPAKSLTLLFWFYALNGNYSLSIGPFFTVFLTVERLIIIRFPLILPKYRKYFLLFVTFLAASLYVTTFSFFLAELPLNPDDALKCAPLVCIAPKFKFFPQLVSKFTYGSCNLFFSIIFFFIVKAELAKKIKNRVVKFTIICELSLNICPTIVNLILTSLTGKNLSQFVGPLDLTMISVDRAICSIFYSWIFLVVARNEERKKTMRKWPEGVEMQTTTRHTH